jgi:tight adherence protein B
LRDYNSYELTIKQKILCILLAAVVIFCVTYIFYRNIFIAAIATPLGLFYPSIRSKQLCLRTKKELNLQFKEMLYSLASSASAGRSMELAFRGVLNDLALIYPDPNTPIIVETGLIVRKLELNENLEDALSDFARRSGVEDIINFAEVFRLSKRTGGNMIEIMRNTTEIINERIETMQIIENIMVKKKFEQKILTILPVALMILLSQIASDYMAPVYTTIAGRIVITVSIFLLIIAFVISFNISNIEI